MGAERSGRYFFRSTRNRNNMDTIVTATIAKAGSRPQTSSTLPPLQPGDVLSRAEFERRYKAHPEIKRAELIEGIVYMPSPVRLTQHAEPHANVMFWLGTYKASTKGIRLGDNGTVRLDAENEVQPDAFLYLPERLGGRTKVSVEDYLEGAPELIVEIADSSTSYDMHQKKRVYARNGVKEYLVRGESGLICVARRSVRIAAPGRARDMAQ